MLCLPVLFPILAGAVMLARPIEDRKKRQIYVAGAGIWYFGVAFVAVDYLLFL